MGWLTRAEAAALTEEQRLDFLTRTILGEAVGEGYTGMLVVAQVIQNRAEDGRWPGDPVAVAGQKNQFTTNSPGFGGNQGMVSANYGPGTKQYRMAQAAARAAIIDQTVPDITGNAVHYHTIAMGYPSTWPSSIKSNGFIDIGDHRVYPQHPVPPGEIPAKLASLQYVDGEVGTILSTYDVRGIKPIRPATMSGTVRLQRELNRVADQKANVTDTVKRSRAFAFGSTIDPFEVGRPSNTDPIINRPVPAMKESMQRELRATGTVNTTERTFAQLVAANDVGMDAPGVTLVSRTTKPPVLQTAPWGVREEVAANVAAADAAAGRGQIVMAGNPNASGAVVAWLYPQIEEGTGEANQEGKGGRGTPAGQIAAGNIDLANRKVLRLPDGSFRTENSISIGTDQGEVLIPTVVNGKQLSEDAAIRHYEQTGENLGIFSDPASASAFAEVLHQTQERRYTRPTPGQSTIERSPPVVQRQPNGTVKVIPQSQIERPNVVQQSIERANKVNDPALAASLAASIAARPVGKPPATRVVQSVPVRPPTSADANTRSARDEQAAARGAGTPARPAATKPPAVTVAQPAGSLAPKEATRLPAGDVLDYTPPKTTLPVLPPPRSNPIGTVPKFAELAAFNQPAAKLSPSKPGTPASVEDRERARKNPLFGTPQAPVDVAPTLAEPELAIVSMPKPRPTTRPQSQAPTPATRRPTTVAPAAVPGRAPLRVVVNGGLQPPTRAPAPVAKPASLYKTNPVEFGRQAVDLSNDTSVGSQADAAAARASGEAWRQSQANSLHERLVR